MMPFRMAISTAPGPQQGPGRVDIHTHASVCNGAACAAGVVTGTAGRDSSRYRYHGNRRTRQKTSWIANAIELKRHTTCVYENTCKFGELEHYFSPSAG